MGALALVYALRTRRLLRFIEEQARHQTFSRDEAPDHRFVGERRKLEVVFRRRGRLGIAVGLAALLLASCSPAATTGVPAHEVSGRHSWTIPDTLRIATGLVPRTLNPLLGTQTIDSVLSRLFSDVLVTVDAHGAFVPDLAREVPTLANGGISADGLTIRYNLRRHVTWQDGRPFTSGDVKFTYAAIMNPNNDIISRHGYDFIKSVDTPDADTVVFHLKARFAPFVATVFGDSDSPYGIVPEHILGKAKSINDVPFNSLPIGTGPFKVVSWQRGNQIELTRYDNYFLGRPKLKSIIVKLTPDENTEITLLQTHEIDWFFEASVNAYRALRAIPAADTRIVLTPYNGYEGIMFNTARAPTSDIRVRRAIVYAIDKSSLVRSMTFGAADAATEDLPSFLWAYDGRQPRTPYNLSAAKRFLAEAGYGPTHRLSLDLFFEQSATLNKALSVQIQSLLAPLGIDIHTHAQLSSLLYGGYGANGTLSRGRYNIALYTWIAGIDPDDSSQFTCANIPPGGYNQSHFCNSEMDAAEAAALESYAQPARKAAYARTQQVLAQNAPLDFLWWPKQIQAVNPDLRGFDPNPVVETWNAWQWSI
jgi:peptide/nickel transport system substrate-binding protein